MSTAWLLLPDFLLIALGYALCRWTALDRPLWNGAERLVYYLLFPVLLFVAIVRQPIAPDALAGHYGRELLRNPLIIGTGAGLAANLFGLQLPELASITLHRLGSAALPIGLMAVGAGLRLGALREAPGLAVALLAIRHAVLPLIALVLVRWAALDATQQAVAVAFAALPTAASAYVLVARMGGRGEYVAGLVTVSTLLGMLSVPVALALHAAWT
jgi:malonate transporter and related proteins